MMARGLDVSAANGAIRWELVPAEFVFVIVKVSEGALGLDPLRKLNMEGAAKSGRLVAAYHYFKSSQDPEAQAERVWDAVGAVMPSFVALDFETLANGLSPYDGVARALRCADALEARFGRPPLLYGYPWFDQHELGDALANEPRLARLPLFMADYRGGESPPDEWHPLVLPPWTDWTLAQTSGNNSSRVPGITGAVDHDIFNGSLEELRTKLCGLPPPGSGEGPAPTVHPPVDLDR